MKKSTKKLLCTLLSVLLIFSTFTACSSIEPVIETTTEPTTSSNVGGVDDETVVISEDVIEMAEDTIEAVENNEDIETSDIAENYIEDEKALEIEQAIEQDAQVEQENISYDGTNTGKGTTLLGACTGITYYSQADSRWANVPYTSIGSKSQTMASSGCGPTSASMIVSSSKGAILPTTMKKIFEDNGFRTAGNGTAWSCWPFVADYFNFNFYKPSSSFSEIEKYLETDNNKDGISDYFVVVSCGSGLFTTGGHYITIMGDSDNVLKIYDPSLYYGKFTTASRKAANVKVVDNVAYVTESAFKQYANAKQYWIFSNDYVAKKNTTAKPTTTRPADKNNTTSSAPKIKYVKTNGDVLNVRSGADIKCPVVKTLNNGTKVSVYATKNGWSKIDKSKSLWVSSDFLKDKTTTTVNKSVVAYIYVPATNRYAYCKYSALEKVNGKYRLKSNTTLYSKSNLTGTKYNYLAKTTVTLKKTITA